MAYTINDALERLSFRLGESSVPSNSTERSRRISWAKQALNYVFSGSYNYWFMQDIYVDKTIVNQDKYNAPPNCQKIIQVKVDDIKYDEIDFKEVYDKYEVPQSPVPILATSLDKGFYQFGDSIYIIPPASSAPSQQNVTSITSSGKTCTVTLTDHGYYTGDYITISGANETEYNGTFRIVKVDDNTFSYTTSTAPTSSPATGTIKAQENNIKIWYYKYPDLSNLSLTSSIIIPDNYIDIIVSYCEARYWSMAHKRAKASDAFTEFDTLVNQLKSDDFKRKFLAND
ncbi:MAG: hypothetical protein QXY47_05490 [Thermoplasmata archaeon]